MDKNAWRHHEVRRLNLFFPLENARVLDLGCGEGDMTRALLDARIAAVGIDVRMDRLHIAQQQAMGMGISSRFLLFDGWRIPFANESIDVVIAQAVLEHIRRSDLRPALREVRRVLRSGGVFFSRTPNLLWPVEGHTHLPLVHWTPRGLQSLIVRRLRPDKADCLETVWLLPPHRLVEILREVFSDVCVVNFEHIRQGLRIPASPLRALVRRVIGLMISRRHGSMIEGGLNYVYPTISIVARR